METYHLDTNFLIALSCGEESSIRRIQKWLSTGKGLAVSAVVWTEFLTGPLDEEQIARMKTLIDEVIPFDQEQAALAADLFNHTGRIKALRMDAMIAAAAITTKSPLATENSADMKRFVSAGLKLLK
jgi:predicted nucleic acid-binding protein